MPLKLGTLPLHKASNKSSKVLLRISRMLTHQNTLPKLPVPCLKDTLQKYLRTVKPLVSENDFSETTKIVQEFGKAGGVGEKLQSLLEERAKVKENWLSEWWLQAAYLDYRLPVVVHSSPGMAFPFQNFKDTDGQLRFAAKIIAAAVQYKIMIDEEALPVDRMQNNPLCMDQYHKIFSACRIPGINRDEFSFFSSIDKKRPSHIVICHNNYFFSLQVVNEQNISLNEEQVLEQLVKIINQSQFPGKPIGILTSEHRNTWGKEYKSLCKDKNNLASVREIQNSLFVVCLDQPSEIDGYNSITQVALQMLHGGGSTYNSGNRWFDKTVQFVIGTNGNCGMTYEHSSAEGPPIASLMDFVLEQRSDKVSSLPSPTLYEPKRLSFNISAGLTEAIEKAKRNLDILIQDTELLCFVFSDFGKDLPKLHKLSPDSFIQIAMQLAYFRLYKYTTATYETASLRRFKLGRTETIRSASNESHKFCIFMSEPNITEAQKAISLREAVEAHKIYTNEAMQGQGIDRHLLGLKLLAIENGMNVPELFMDTTYSTSIHFRLSSSQVPAKVNSFLCFGPVVPDGYGVCYNPQEHCINFSLSAFNSSPDTSVQKYRSALEQSLKDMRDVLLKTQQAKL